MHQGPAPRAAGARRRRVLRPPGGPGARRPGPGRAGPPRARRPARSCTTTSPTSSATACSASSDRPPRPADDFSEHALSAELDQLCADHGFGRLDELDDDELRSLAEALDRFERRVSGERQEVFAELDDLTDELVIRYREQAGDLDDEDDDDDERVVDGADGDGRR